MGDLYRPSRNHPPPLADRITFASGGGDSYRPASQQGSTLSEFTFSTSRQGPQFPPTGPRDSNASSSRQRNPGGRRGKAGNQRGSERSSAAHRSGGRRDQSGFGRGGFRGFRKEAPHERALLQTFDGTGPEQTLGVTEGVNKFRSLEDLSASEDDMDPEDDIVSGNDSGEEGSRKVARVQASHHTDGDSVPKWSNPDPYYVLPPPSESTGKKRDFVQWIRKAKNQSIEKFTANNAIAANNDFISLGDEEEKENNEDEDEDGLVSSGVPPPPPRSLRPPSPRHPLTGSLNDIASTGALSKAPQNAKRSAEVAGLPQKSQRSDRHTSKRKRGQFEGGIVQEWLANASTSASPWCKNGRWLERISREPISEQEKLYRVLHNEIMDFYDYVRPDATEDRVRVNLMKRIEASLGRKHAVFPDTCTVQCFGSFPAKLYLPTADMDLVLVSNQHKNSGVGMLNFDSKKMVGDVLNNTARKLKRERVAINTQVITRAKVPIIKFVDQTTNIKVDLSFENLTGVEAQTTFRNWQEQNGDVPLIVALVKQFLLMRGLNDVHTGGLGGFSIICLVYFYLSTQGKDHEGLGHLFLGFLDFFGNKFDLATHRLNMGSNPPKIETKVSF